MHWLFSLYLGTTVFGIGVLTIDMLGLLDHNGNADTSDSDTADADGDADSAGESDSDTDGTSSDADGADTSVVDHANSGDDAGDSAGGHAGASDADHTDSTDDSAAHDADSTHGHEHVEAGHHAVSTVMHDKAVQGNALLKTISLLRTAVYFCAGFGPVGLFAWLTHQGALASFLWSVPVGLATAIITRLLMRLFKKEVDSSVKEDELLMETGQVIVTIGKGELGKVRVHLGEIYVDRFARAKSKDETIPIGSDIRVCDIEEDCLIVEREGV